MTGETAETLKKEIKEESIKTSEYEVTTIYIGGGTPSYIDSNFIVQILTIIKENYIISKNVEITIEVNPGTVNEEKLTNYKIIGINRISIGLQETDNKLLKLIGRIHTYEDFLETYKLARKVGFRNINVDLMIGLPTQNLEDVTNSVNKIIKLEPEHISVYSLIVEEGTKIEEKITKAYLKKDTEYKIVDMIIDPVKPKLVLDPSIKDFFDFDNSKDLKHVTVEDYKHMGKINFPVAQ